MIFGVIVAGGIGSRMGAALPKQFIEIGGKPIIMHTLDRFLDCPGIDHTLILCPEDWTEHLEGLCRKYACDDKRISVTCGGASRNETIMKGLEFIDENFGIDQETVVVTHDAVRPFVTREIIERNIDCVLEWGACTTAVPATDTILEANGDLVAGMPDRSRLYNVQTPQCFRAAELRRAYRSLSDEEKAVLTDAARIYITRGMDVKIVMGDVSNIKITYPYDLITAESILTQEEK